MAKSPRLSARAASSLKTFHRLRDDRRPLRSNLYLVDAPLRRGAVLEIPRHEPLRLTKPTLLVFADDAPLFNWGHPCRYLLHDAESLELYGEVDAQFPPVPGIVDSYERLHPLDVVISPARTKPGRKVDLAIPRTRRTGKLHVLLFSGMSNNRHTNDLEFLYRTLRDVYLVPDANIRVLNHDGTLNYDGSPKPVTAWPGDGTPYRMTVHAQGSRAALLAELDRLKKILRPDDSLLIHTNNHGGHNGTESDLCCFPSWDSLGVKDFTDKLGELPKFRCLMVMMEQCHSGGFNKSILAKSTAGMTSVSSACEELKNSIGGADFDPFARDWIAAMAGLDPYGAALDHNPDLDSDGRVTANEAFAYADSIHHPYDTPVYDDQGGGGGCSLGRELIRVHIPPLEVWPTIRRHWPDPDPPVVEQLIERVQPQIDRIDEAFATALAEIEQDYVRQLTEVLKEGGKRQARRR